MVVGPIGARPGYTLRRACPACTGRNTRDLEWPFSSWNSLCAVGRVLRECRDLLRFWAIPISARADVDIVCCARRGHCSEVAWEWTFFGPARYAFATDGVCRRISDLCELADGIPKRDARGHGNEPRCSAPH